MRWQNYPRPQLRRKDYCLLNGTWQLDGQDIMLPFAPQSRLSGYKETVGEHLVYEKTFELPEDWNKERVLLHFGAVDQICEVFVNEVSVGKHEGGYLHFSFLSLLALLWNSEFRWVIFPFLHCLLLLFFSQLFVRPPRTSFVFPHFFFLGIVLITACYTMSQTLVHSSSGTVSIRYNPLNLCSLPLYNCKGFDLGHT